MPGSAVHAPTLLLLSVGIFCVGLDEQANAGDMAVRHAVAGLLALEAIHGQGPILATLTAPDCCWKKFRLGSRRWSAS